MYLGNALTQVLSILNCNQDAILLAENAQDQDFPMNALLVQRDFTLVNMQTPIFLVNVFQNLVEFHLRGKFSFQTNYSQQEKKLMVKLANHLIR
jgi:hypothetical protein